MQPIEQSMVNCFAFGKEFTLWLKWQKDRYSGVYIMFIAISNFPPIQEGKDAEFREWFTWTNKEFSKFKGFIGRRLLKPTTGGNYDAVVEFESQETFMALHNSPIHAEAGKRVNPLLNGSPTPHFYEVIIG